MMKDCFEILARTRATQIDGNVSFVYKQKWSGRIDASKRAFSSRSGEPCLVE
jgi:hypothetical protein